MNIINRLVCRVMGHKRGKRDAERVVNIGEQAYRCPRCGATWTRRVKVKAI